MDRSGESFHIRRAIPADVPAIEALIGLSVRTLQTQDYSQAQIEGALSSVFGADSALIADGTYFVLEAVFDGGKAIIVGCGGWSRRKTLFGGDRASGREDSLLDPLRDAAKIRAFFVHPEFRAGRYLNRRTAVQGKGLCADRSDRSAPRQWRIASGNPNVEGRLESG